jgi:hypothetical protein
MIEIRRVQIRDTIAWMERRRANPEDVIYIVIMDFRRVDSFMAYRNAQRCVRRLKGVQHDHPRHHRDKGRPASSADRSSP